MRNDKQIHRAIARVWCRLLDQVVDERPVTALPPYLRSATDQDLLFHVTRERYHAHAAIEGQNAGFVAWAKHP